MPSPSKCCWPITSLKRFGRSRSARGALSGLGVEVVECGYTASILGAGLSTAASNTEIDVSSGSSYYLASPMSLSITTAHVTWSRGLGRSHQRLRRSAVGVAALLMLSACASLRATSPPTPPTPPSPPPSPPTATAADPAAVAKPPLAAASKPAEPAAPKPFAEVIKGATQQDGLFAIWRKDEKAWLEIPKSALNKPFLFTVNIANSIGERGLYASQMNTDVMAEWRRIGNQVQLLALNTKFRAR